MSSAASQDEVSFAKAMSALTVEIEKSLMLVSFP
jgi:hypothetical protein